MSYLIIIHAIIEDRAEKHLEKKTEQEKHYNSNNTLQQ
jgi:hypothetical protein